jgi:Helix-turn-helix domain
MSDTAEKLVNEVEVSPSGLMDLPNAAKYMGVPQATIRWERRMHRIPAVKLGKRLMFLQKDLDNFIVNRKEIDY